MTEHEEQQAALLDAYWEALIVDRAAHLPDGLDPQLATLALRLEARLHAPDPDAGFRTTLAQRLDEQARSIVTATISPNGRAAHVPSRLSTAAHGDRQAAHGWQRAAVLVLALIGIGVALLALPGVRAQIERAGCWVPGLGIRGCGDSALVAPRPVSVTRDGATLTVKSLLSSEGQTALKLEITGLPELELTGDTEEDLRRLRESQDQGQIGIRTRVTLRDPSGKEYGPTGRTPYLQGFGSGAIHRGALRVPQSFTSEPNFDALPQEARFVDVLVDGPPPIGNWQVRVPIVPAQESGLPAAQSGGPGVALHGITVSVVSAVTDAERTVVQLRAQWQPEIRRVVGLGDLFPGRRLILRDDQGREYTESPTPAPPVQPATDAYTLDITFPPLAPDARTAELELPFVTIIDAVGTASLTVPIAGVEPGQRIPLTAELSLGPYPVRITGAEMIKQAGQRKLALHLDLGDWRDGRRLVGPMAVETPGGSGFEGQLDPRGVGQWTQARVVLPPDPGPEVTVMFRNAQVAVEGPWRLSVPVSR